MNHFLRLGSLDCVVTLPSNQRLVILNDEVFQALMMVVFTCIILI